MIPIHIFHEHSLWSICPMPDSVLHDTSHPDGLSFAPADELARLQRTQYRGSRSLQAPNNVQLAAEVRKYCPEFAEADIVPTRFASF